MYVDKPTILHGKPEENKTKNTRNKMNPPQSKWLAIRDCKKITTKSRKGNEIGQ
jgi:hypothetical protein